MGSVGCCKIVDRELINQHSPFEGGKFTWCKLEEESKQSFDKNLSHFFSLPILPQTFPFYPSSPLIALMKFSEK